MLRRVRLQNFKSFQDVSIELGRRNILVGPNMSGKSNFLGVFRFLLQVAYPKPGTWGLANAFSGGFFDWTWKGTDSNLIKITLEGELPTSSTSGKSDWEYELAVVGDERGSIRVQDEILSVTVDGRIVELITRKDGVRTLTNRDGREVYGSMEATRAAALEFEIPDWDGAFLRKTIASWRFYNLVPFVMRQFNPASAPPFLTEHGDNLSAWLMNLQTRHDDSFAKIQQVCRDVFPGLDSLFTSPTQQATVWLGARERHLIRQVSVFEMSAGELVFIALLSLIFAPREVGASLYCIEEPENHLHPRLIETLVELLRQRHDDFKGAESAQVIATTHSPHLVDRTSLDELIVFERRNGATLVTYPRDKKHLQQLLQSQELGLGDLFYSGALQSG